ncbi:hypothetical protein C9H29_000613 [Salmonella enterica subsp. enterica serovar Thompson]|nr:hypothetical protein [Salmonella enterica subsp. enterica serovar Thompson]
MTTITKERIELFVKSPLENGLTRGEQMDLARIALASLEAEPIGAFHIEDQQVSGTTDYIKDGEWPIDNGVIEVYAVPPAPVVPDDWVMVPKEPTRQMMAQGHFAMKGTDRGKFRRIYQAMITAAPDLNKGGINAE